MPLWLLLNPAKGRREKLGPYAEQIHPPTMLWSTRQLGLRTQAFAMPLDTGNLSRSAWLCPLCGAGLIPKDASAATWLIPLDPPFLAQAVMAGGTDVWAHTQHQQLQGQPGVTK